MGGDPILASKGLASEPATGVLYAVVVQDPNQGDSLLTGGGSPTD
jgi:hypothetical protein